MAYMIVDKQTEDILILKRSPGLRSLLVVIAIYIALVYAANQEWFLPSTSEAKWWFPLSAIGAFFVSLACLDDWEVCKFDGKQEKVTITKQSIFGRVIGSTASSTVVDTSTICDVVVKSEVLKYTKTTVRYVCLVNEEHHIYSITDCGTSDPISEHQKIKKLIEDFLKVKN